VRPHHDPGGDRRRVANFPALEPRRKPIGALRHILPYLKRHKTALVFGGISVLLTNLFQVWSPWLVRQAVDHLQAGVARALIARDAGLILLAVVLQGIFLFTMRMTLIRTSRRVEYELRTTCSTTSRGFLRAPIGRGRWAI